MLSPRNWPGWSGGRGRADRQLTSFQIPDLKDRAHYTGRVQRWQAFSDSSPLII